MNAGAANILASMSVGPIQFDAPVWLWLIPICGVPVLWWGRSSLSGLGTVTRRVALAIRLIVITILAAAMAEPQWRNEAKSVAVTFVIDASRSIPQHWQRDIERYVEEARKNNKIPEDQLGVITVASDAYVQSLPSKLNTKVEKQFIGPDQATNLAGGLRLGMAIKREDAANRLVLVSDGNETAGNVLEAAEAAKAMKVPIDVLPVTYSSDGEVVVDQVVAPTTARMGENINLKVVLNATKPAVGRLSVLINGDPIDLDPESEGLGEVVKLTAGPNVLSIPVTVPRAGPQQFKAVFEPLAEAGKTNDTIQENNEALAVTFVSSEGRTLVITESVDEAAPLVRALTESKIATDVVTAEQAPKSLTELNAYDAVILVNEPAYNFSQQTQEDLKQYVHDSGGGLLMLGGPAAFGAGGWIGSPLEDALPIKLDPPQKRQMPRGALAIITHSIEMPDGVNFGKKTAKAAIEALSRLDLAGLVEFDGSQAVWRHPMAEVGDGSAIRRSIENLHFGDMPDYNDPMELTLKGLVQVQAGTKHVILITDGDASAPTPRLLQLYNKERITVSTVGSTRTLRAISRSSRTSRMRPRAGTTR
jgi:Mg-chelatase subunit ChlD